MILVVGTGRSGTSALARCLHELGICMGHKFIDPDGANPKGYWEDMYARHLFDFVLGEQIIDGVDWRRTVEKEHLKFDCKANQIGVKHPLLCQFSDEVLDDINPEYIFWATRNREDTIKSIMDYKARRGLDRIPEHERFVPREKAAKLVDSRLAKLTERIGPREHTKIDFTRHISDGAIKAIIKGVIDV